MQIKIWRGVQDGKLLIMQSPVVSCHFLPLKPKYLPHLLILERPQPVLFCQCESRGELSYLAPLGSENISAPYFKQCFFRGGGITPPD